MIKRLACCVDVGKGGESQREVGGGRLSFDLLKAWQVNSKLIK
jgi:hypothetical protein